MCMYQNNKFDSIQILQYYVKVLWRLETPLFFSRRKNDLYKQGRIYKHTTNDEYIFFFRNDMCEIHVIHI